MRKIKHPSQPARWRKQHFHNQAPNRCPDCGKLYFRDESQARIKASELSRVHGKQHSVYVAHGRFHTTTQVSSE